MHGVCASPLLDESMEKVWREQEYVSGDWEGPKTRITRILGRERQLKVECSVALIKEAESHFGEF